MGIEGLDEKIEVAKKVVTDYARRFRNQDDCETDVLIDTCKSMYQDIAGCFGYSVTEDEFYTKHGSKMDIMREIRQDVEQFSNKYQNGDPCHRATIRTAFQLAQPPGVVIKNCGRDYIREASDWLEKIMKRN